MVRVYQGNHGDAYGDFTLVYQATLEGATFEWQSILFTVRSRQAELDIKADGGTFLGDNFQDLDDIYGHLDLSQN